MSLNVLLITLDQFRADCLSVAGHPLVKTPNLDRLAKQGVRLTKHYSQCAPCSPGRASLYTGMYQMNHRVVANGTPLNRSFDNVALLAQRAGYAPALFGYTDQAIDPRDATGPDDWRLTSYEGVLPGFDCKLFIPQNHDLWIEHLRVNGFDVPMNAQQALSTEPDRPAEFGISAFLTDHLLTWLRQQQGA
jgi:arylsulfatase A-like enzyme